MNSIDLQQSTQKLEAMCDFVMISCKQRETVTNDTLERLSKFSIYPKVYTNELELPYDNFNTNNVNALSDASKDYIVTMEDDLLFADDFVDSLWNVINSDVSFCSMYAPGNSFYSKKSFGGFGVHKAVNGKKFFGSQCYVFKNEFAKTVRDKILEVWKPLDTLIAKWFPEYIHLHVPNTVQHLAPRTTFPNLHSHISFTFRLNENEKILANGIVVRTNDIESILRTKTIPLKIMPKKILENDIVMLLGSRANDVTHIGKVKQINKGYISIDKIVSVELGAGIILARTPSMWRYIVIDDFRSSIIKDVVVNTNS